MTVAATRQNPSRSPYALPADLRPGSPGASAQVARPGQPAEYEVDLISDLDSRSALAGPPFRQ